MLDLISTYFFSANISSVVLGMIQGWPSPSLPLLRDKATSVTEEVISAEDESWIGSLAFLGALIASPVFSFINQKFGRKAAGYATAIPMIIGWLMIIFANNIILLYAARIILGSSMSGASIFVTMYVGEISEDGIRGALGTIRGISADLGIIFIYTAAPNFSIQTMGIIAISIPILFLFLYFWLPESPMYLLWKGKSEEAKKAYLWLRGGDQQAADEEMSKLKTVIAKSEDNNTTFRELVSVRGTRKALYIIFVMAIVQQFSGMLVVFSYYETILQMTGSTIPPNLAAITFGIVNLIGSLFSYLCSDSAGRRMTLTVAQILQGVSLGALGSYLYARELGADVSIVGVLPVICLSLYCFCVIAGLANLFYVVLSEIFRPEARGLASNIASATVWFLGFLATKFYSLMEDKMGPHGCFFMFTAVSLAGAAFVYLQLPETKNRSLESILRELNGDPSEDEN